LIELVGDAEMTYELLHNLLMIMMENHLTKKYNFGDIFKKGEGNIFSAALDNESSELKKMYNI
jgi:hypothetical protein